MAGQDRKRPRWIRHSGVGIEFAAAVGGFGLLGWWIDRHYGTKPWGLLICVVLGLLGATYNLVRESMAAFRETAEEDSNRDEKRSPKQ